MLWVLLAILALWAVLAILALPESAASKRTGELFNLEKTKFIVELVAIAVAVVTLVFFWQQNELVRQDIEQNKLQFQSQLDTQNMQFQSQLTLANEQNMLVQEQIQAQATQSATQVHQQQEIYIDTRRAELLETIYGRRDCDKEDINDCPLVASIRVRAEAALVFIKIEKKQRSHA